MSDANRRTLQVLREFKEQLESGRPLVAYMVRRIETPDGPMHVQERVELAPYCGRCGENFDECDCQ